MKCNHDTDLVPGASNKGVIFKRTCRLRSRCALALVGVLFGAGGCASTSSNEPSAQTKQAGQRLFASSVDAEKDVKFDDEKPDASKAAKPAARTRTTWAILLSGIDGEGHAARAASTADGYRNRFGLQGVFVERRGAGSAVLYGAFAEPAEGQKALASIRNIEDRGERPFARALLVPPDVQGSNGDAKLDLAKARKPSDPSELYSVQIAFFQTESEKPSPDEVARVRTQAENFAGDLRKKGEQAYYLHGTGGRSIVTIGIFDTDDNLFSPLRAVMKKHPVNYVNGKPGEIRLPNGAKQPQPCVLVKVP